MTLPLRVALAIVAFSFSVAAIAGVVTGIQAPDNVTPGNPTQIGNTELDSVVDAATKTPSPTPYVDSSCYSDHLFLGRFPANSRMLVGSTQSFNAHTVENIWDSYQGWVRFSFYDPRDVLVETKTLVASQSNPVWGNCGESYDGWYGGCSTAPSYTVGPEDRGVNSVIAEGEYYASVPNYGPGMLYGCELETFTVQDPPLANAGAPRSGNVGQTITFDGSASKVDEFAENPSGRYCWNFGDGTGNTCGAANKVTHAYSAPPASGYYYYVTLNLSDGVYSSSSQTTALVQAPGGSFGFSASSYTVQENGGIATNITVLRTGSVSQPASVLCSTANDTAVAGTDYTATQQPLSWTANETTPKTCNVSITDNSTWAPNKRFTVSLSSPSSGSYVGGTSGATVTIQNDEPEPAGTVSFDQSHYTWNNTGTTSVDVIRTGSNGSGGNITATVQTSDGTAHSPTHYTATTCVLSWGNHEVGVKRCSIPTGTGSAVKGLYFSVSITGTSGGATIGTPSTVDVQHP